MEKETNDFFLKTLGYDFTTNSFIDEKSHPEPDSDSDSELDAAPDPEPEVIIAKEDESLSTYKFPFTQEQLLRMEKKIDANTSEYYLTTMQELCFDSRDASGNPLPYCEIRKRVILSSIMLNIKGEIAPRFRPMRTPKKPKKGEPYPEDQNLLSNDRQIIDLLWIHRQGLFASDIKNFKGLFNCDKPFDIDKATKFVNKVGTKQLKAELIALPSIEQFQLASIQSADVKSRWERINQYCIRNQIKVKEFFTSTGSRYSVETIKSATDIYKSILIANGSATAAQKIYMLMTGKTINKKNFERYTKRLSSAGLVS